MPRFPAALLLLLPLIDFAGPVDRRLAVTIGWAMADGKPNTFHAGEPVVPGWLLQRAGVDPGRAERDACA